MSCVCLENKRTLDFNVFLGERTKPDLIIPEFLPYFFHCYLGPLTREFLRQLAGDLGDEWRQVAEFLGVSPARVESIKRDHLAARSMEPVIFDVLRSWYKNANRNSDKVIKNGTTRFLKINLCSGKRRGNVRSRMHFLNNIKRLYFVTQSEGLPIRSTITETPCSATF